ncbi:hypothetical protein [Bacillus thuringiensis]|uniref:hypothetical protein n=1 Tax=Bacillus thuringiensis TaxID=1428 RepID=UPI0011A6A6FD|nr:hypothetical protein [Bacillus thuringiensis]MDM8365783.1 hypothetical protein [Bacillus thuringiensis]
MKKKYQLAEHLIIRKEDLSLFDSKNVNMINLNASGFHLIHYLENKSLSKEEFKEFSIHSGITEEDFEEFLGKCMKYELIKEL